MPSTKTIYEFEPGASSKLLLKVTNNSEYDDTDYSNIGMKVTLTVGRTTMEIFCTWDAERQGYALNPNKWAEIIKSTQLHIANIYMNWGYSWINVGYINLQPKEGATWQRTA